MKVYCYSKFAFVNEMKRLGWNDVTLPKDVAIISICCTEPVKEHWKSNGCEGTEDEHYFRDAENGIYRFFKYVNVDGKKQIVSEMSFDTMK